MAAMTSTLVSTSFSVSLASGQTLQIQILNADGSVSQTICADTVPASSNFLGSTGYGGKLS